MGNEKSVIPVRKLVCHNPNAEYTVCDWKTCPIQMPRAEWADLVHHYCEFRYVAEEKRVKRKEKGN